METFKLVIRVLGHIALRIAIVAGVCFVGFIKIIFELAKKA